LTTFSKVCIILIFRKVIMSGWLILLTGAIYLWVCIDQALKGNIGMGIAYAGYAFSNIGLYLLATK
jgi:hypothetical protein